MSFDASLAWARKQDRSDELAGFRDRFHIPTQAGLGDVTYLCGHSLGLQPASAATLVAEELEAWATLGVRGHFEGQRPWLPYHEQLTELAAELVGAAPLEVVAMNTLTVNLHLLMVSFYRPTPERFKLLIEKPAFPSDRYATESQVKFHGLDPAEALVEIEPRPGEDVIREADLYELIARAGPSIALIMLPGVQYYSGQLFDMAEITRLAHAEGCTVGFDLAHAAGNVPLALHDWDVDFACWCTYKYLNGGPGAVAAAFVHERYANDTDLPRFAGWWGQDKSIRFHMGPGFEPIPGAEGWQLSNPPILSLAPVIAALEIFREAGMERLRAKSLQLTAYFESLLRERLPEGIEIITPSEPERRGCQLSIRLPRPGADGRKLFEQLEASGAICDWREPDVIRAAPVPLYNGFADVYRFVEVLHHLLQGGV